MTSDYFKWGTQTTYLWSYAIFVGAFGIALFIRGTFYYWAVISGNTRLHNRLFSRVLKAPMLFFNQTPIGKILTHPKPGK
jgi:ABC-type multidrug transport system fused ATPase/permease subunit